MIIDIPVDGERKKVIPLPPPNQYQYGNIWASYMSEVGNVLAPQPMPALTKLITNPRKDGVVPLRTFVLTTAGNKPGEAPYWHGLGGTNGNGLWVCAPGGRWPIMFQTGDLGFCVERTDNNDFSPLSVLIELYPAA